MEITEEMNEWNKQRNVQLTQNNKISETSVQLCFDRLHHEFNVPTLHPVPSAWSPFLPSVWSILLLPSPSAV